MRPRLFTPLKVLLFLVAVGVFGSMAYWLSIGAPLPGTGVPSTAGKIVFVSDRDGHPDLWMMDAATGENAVAITSDDAVDRQPVFNASAVRSLSCLKDAMAVSSAGVHGRCQAGGEGHSPDQHVRQQRAAEVWRGGAHLLPVIRQAGGNRPRKPRDRSAVPRSGRGKVPYRNGGQSGHPGDRVESPGSPCPRTESDTRSLSKRNSVRR
jgi:hypothetical protein